MTTKENVKKASTKPSNKKIKTTKQEKNDSLNTIIELIKQESVKIKNKIFSQEEIYKFLDKFNLVDRWYFWNWFFWYNKKI